MVLVPAGDFIMGSDNDVYYLDEDQKPAHNVFLDAFYIDEYEVTNQLYKACVDAGVCKRPTTKVLTTALHIMEILSLITIL